MFMITAILLYEASKLSDTFFQHRLVIDSKYRMPQNNYPLTALGFLDASLKFHLLSIAISNREARNFMEN